MFDAKDLFKERLINHMHLLNRYLRYLFNGHFMIAILFLIITLSIYYQHWLETVSPNFPSSAVIAIILGFVVSYNPMQYFLREPDQVFLMVKEREMGKYFRYALTYNYFVQLYLVVVSLAVIGPLYSQMYQSNSKTDFLLIIAIMLVLKGWNLWMNWVMFKVRNQKVIWLDKLLRTLLSIGIFYFLLEKHFFIIIVAVLYFIRVLNNYFLTKKQPSLTWDVLIENDRHRLAVFYRFASNFVNVPNMTKRMKKRRLLAKVIERIVPFKHSATFTYLYRLTFLRSSDYFNLYVRLTVIGGIVIYFIPNMWVKVAISLLFIYMTSFQLIPLFHHYRTSIWMDLYPVENDLQQRSFLKDMRVITVIQTVLFSLLFIFSLDWLGFVITLAVGGLFTYLFYEFYVKKRIAL